MTYDEGLRSPKAIAFIAAKRKNSVNSQTISYLELGATPKQKILAKQTPSRRVSKNLGEIIYG
ncbi:MAG: hypothetical protein NWE96_11045 [Candidatus Bathyarchaeota archaeon]|nr:hypothetical protein [Candidatus Bathyarchaeota archaeon]